MENNLKSPDYLLNHISLPAYRSFSPEDAEIFLDSLILEAKSTILEIQSPSTFCSWETVVEPLSKATERLSRIWSAVHHLGGVVDSPEWRKITNKKMQVVTEFWTELSQNSTLADKTESLRNSKSVVGNQNRTKVIENFLYEFKLGGATLNLQEKKTFAVLEEKLASLSQKFSENILDSTKSNSIHLEENNQLNDRLSGLPSYVISQAQETAKSQKLKGVVFTLLAPCVFPVLQYSKDQALRFSIYSRHARKASELAEEGNQFDNSNVMAEILKLRYQKAKLLGFRTAAEMSLATKMAKSPKEVIEFLLDLAKKATPTAVKDLEELNSFASSKLNINELQSWDIAFASEELRKEQFNFSDEELRKYFPLEKVLDGMFKITKKLFGCNVKALNNINSDVLWHEDVLVFEVIKENKQIGHLFMDLFARDTKRSGAWMDDSRGRYVVDGKVQNPIALLNCNFSPPEKNGSCYLTHDEVLTLFHEFGHGLHHLMTDIDEIEISGINGVEWDAVELPSQFMENFCWEYKNLRILSANEKTGAPIPEELFKKINKAKNFQSGLQMLRQVEFSLFDIRIHNELEESINWSKEKIVFKVFQILNKTRDEIALVKPPNFQRFPQSFSHIFAGGYSAGYYSYKWAEVLSADCYSVFENKTDEQQSKLGEQFLKQFLSKGGSRTALKSFTEFMNREPSPDALLKHCGLSNSTL